MLKVDIVDGAGMASMHQHAAMHEHNRQRSLVVISDANGLARPWT